MSLGTKRLAEEGGPIAAVLLFWNALAAVVDGLTAVSSALAGAGVAMAALYVAVRGATLAGDASPLTTGDFEAVVSENVRVAVPAGGWFLGGAVVAALHRSYLGNELFGAVAAALAGAGLGVVAVYAVAVGVATFDRRRFGPRGRAGGADAPDGDGRAPAGD